MNENSSTRARLGLQLYTIRDDLERDYRGTLETIARLGFDGVELAGNHGRMSGPQLRRLLDGLGLAVAGAHVGLEQLEADPEREADLALELGAPGLAVPWGKAADDAGWLALADRLEALGARLARRGLRLGYHNHAHELELEAGGRPALDVLLARAPGVDAELDVAWIHAGGRAPTEYLARYAGRVPLVHLKDVRKQPDGGWLTVELGQGEVDLPAVVAAAGQAGAEWLIVEQDRCQRAPLESVEASLAHLRGLVSA